MLSNPPSTASESNIYKNWKLCSSNEDDGDNEVSVVVVGVTEAETVEVW